MTALDSLEGKTALVTGATGGIGKEIARGLLRLGAHVLIGARNPQRGAAARDQLAQDGSVGLVPLDVASFASIRAAAENFPAERLDILVNNAGAWFSDRRESVDGYELTFATNVLGPHLITRLLGPRLRAPARIVNIVSGLAANYDAEDLLFERRKYDGFKAYAQSKAALRMLTWGQSARLSPGGITANAAAPGFVRSDFNQNAHGFVPSLINLMARLFAVTPEKGADTPIWVASASELASVSGKYFDARKEKDGKFHDPAVIADLERRCDEMVAGPRAAARRAS
jgi:NAD(P)-dependent dehydrogenase (short-subunit alcohol dehydrogenase family)